MALNRRTVGQDCTSAGTPFAPLQGGTLARVQAADACSMGSRGEPKSPLPWGYRGSLEAPLIGDATATRLRWAVRMVPPLSGWV